MWEGRGCEGGGRCGKGVGVREEGMLEGEV